ncbi:MAG TPA: hypothetical protein VGB98_17375 [Pyrinomonadaceae bacterium]|jgi:hypothetical protein
MSFDIEELYKLLPAVYRIRDMRQGTRVPPPAPGEGSLAVQDERGEYLSVPLKELLSVITDQVVVLEENLAQLYDDQFVETCAPWALPYIGDLIGLAGLPGDAAQGLTLTPRAEVANTIGYRRRKGTAAMLEQLARDVTGWPARAVEFFQLLAWTQYMNHLRPLNLSFAHVRDANRLEWLGTPFEHTSAEPDPPLPTAPPRGDGYRLPGVKETLGSIFLKTKGVADLAHTVDVRRVATARGRYNIPNIGIFLWRLHAYSLKCAHAVPVNAADTTRYLFNPLGSNTPLFIRPVTETEVTHLAEPVNTPLRITRRVLRRNLMELYGNGRSLLVMTEQPDGQGGTMAQPVPVSEVEVCDLSDVRDGSGQIVWAHTPTTHVSIDPVLGRVAFPSSQTNVLVNFHYGFSDDMGGGEYARAGARRGAERIFTVANVPGEQGAHATLASARDALVATPPGPAKGVVEIQDSGRYPENIMVVNVTGRRVEIRAAEKRRPTVAFRNQLTVKGGESDELTLDGLVITGVLRIAADVGRLRLRHCTLVPGVSLQTDGSPAQPNAPSLIIESPQAVVEIDRCIVGGLRSAPDARVLITDSIVDATSPRGVAFAGLSGAEPGGTLRVENSTIIGRVHASAIELASNTIFHAALPADAPPGSKAVQVVRRQEGCVRFSCLPVSASVPRRYRSLPETADPASPRPKLLFVSTRYGEPAYCQLSALCGAEIRRGADDESEMGAFHGLHQPQREAHLRARLEEYLRFGLEAGIFYAS